MTQATILVEELPGTSPEKVMKIAHISGQLDESNIDEKIQEIYKVVEANPKNLNMVFDLENLEYMNSKSIGYITDLYGKITDSGGQVVIIKARPNILDILNVVGLTQLIKAFSSLEEAKLSLASSAATIAPATSSPIETLSNPVASAPVVAPAPQTTPVTGPVAPPTNPPA